MNATQISFNSQHENYINDIDLPDLTSLIDEDLSSFDGYTNFLNDLITIHEQDHASNTVSNDELHDIININSPIFELGVKGNLKNLTRFANLVDRIERPPAVVNTRITAELTTAITTFLTNISMAITTLITDIQAAIAANPILALLFALPLVYFLLQWINPKGHGYKHDFGHGHGGGYHRRNDWESVYRHFHENSVNEIASDLLHFIENLQKVENMKNNNSFATNGFQIDKLISTLSNFNLTELVK